MAKTDRFEQPARGTLFDDRRIFIVGSSADGGTKMQTETRHGLSAGDIIQIKGHKESEPRIAGDYAVVSVPSPTEFIIDLELARGGKGGFLVRIGVRPS